MTTVCEMCGDRLRWNHTVRDTPGGDICTYCADEEEREEEEYYAEAPEADEYDEEDDDEDLYD